MTSGVPGWLTPEPVEVERRGDTIYDSLRHLIVSGAMPPWTRMVEEDLAKEFHTSRSPVREALRRLSHDGLVRTLRRGHLVTVPISEDERRELHQLRLEVDRLAARLACERNPTPDWTPAREAVTGMAFVMERDGLESKEFALAHQRVHETIYRVSFTGSLPVVYARQVLSIASFVATPSERMPTVSPIAQHNELIDELASGDLDRALDAATHHAEDGFRRASEYFSRSAGQRV